MDGEHNLFTCKGCTWLLDIDVPSHGFITFSRKQAVCRHRSKFTLVDQTNPCLHHTPVYIRLRYRVNDTVHATGLIEIPFWSQLIGSRSCRVLLIMTFIRRANPTLACWRAKLEPTQPTQPHWITTQSLFDAIAYWFGQLLYYENIGQLPEQRLCFGFPVPIILGV